MSERRKVLELFCEQKDFMDEKINSGIEKYRKGDAKISLKDESGNAIADARITVKQKSHEFKFGANLFMLDELETEAKNESYKKLFADVFNMATLPFYWDATEPEEGETRYGKESKKIYRRPAIDLCIEFCKEHGIEPREHALAYEHFFPKWLYDASIDEVKTALERRYKEISERYKEDIRTIEVTNEMGWPTGRTAFYEDPDYVEWCFRLAEKYFPENQIAINEETIISWAEYGRTTGRYYAYTEALLQKGVRIDAIGTQFHMFWKAEDEYEKTRVYYNPKNLYKNMDLYSRFGKPLQVTEITVPAYSNEDEDEAVQAEILEKLYSIWFSHPSVEQIVYWNMVDGYAHVVDPDPEKIRATQGNMTVGENYYYGGLLRFDMTPKPAYKTLWNLIKNKWHTEESLVSNATGCVDFRGFYGKYELEIERDGRKTIEEIDLKKGSANEFIIEL